MYEWYLLGNKYLFNIISSKIIGILYLIKKIIVVSSADRLFIFVFICLLVCQSVYLFHRLSGCLSVFFISLFICLFIYQLTYLSVCLLFCLTVFLFISLSIRLYVGLPASLYNMVQSCVLILGHK